MLRKKLRHALLISFALTIAPHTVNARPPVVIELFGRNSCITDSDIQEDIKNIIDNQEDIILINCRQMIDPTKDSNIYTHDFCKKRAQGYSRNIFSNNVVRIVNIFVNGRWSANRKDISPAINMARQDNIIPIKIEKTNDVLNISIPEIQNKKSGEIVIFGYMPTLDKKEFIVDPDVNLSKDDHVKIIGNQSVPFVTKTRSEQFLLKPVLSMETIGYWHGNEMHLSFPTESLARMAGSNRNDVSYIVTLHDSDRFGPILAAGEFKSQAELNNDLPKSEALDIEFYTPIMR